VTDQFQLMDDSSEDPEAADLARRRLASAEVTALAMAELACLKELAWQLCRFRTSASTARTRGWWNYDPDRPAIAWDDKTARVPTT
jgi:hypothetical protein